MRIGVLTAMSSEFEQLAKLLAGVERRVKNDMEYLVGTLDANEIVLRQCGIGKVNAAVGTSELIRSFSPDIIVSTGVAGGIDGCLDVMDVVVSSSIVYHDVWCGMGCEYGQVQGMPAVFPVEERLYAAAVALNGDANAKSRIHEGLICTGDQFITSRDELSKIKANFPAGLAVDMDTFGTFTTDFAYTAEYVWLHENAWKFGFILRFPEDKMSITTIQFEPWHYRYVGRYHAKKIYDSGLCLEEYVEYLNNN
jgi:adenosylhomocysteine nucleosidase